MKIWIKYLIGVALGIVAAIILPSDNISIKNALEFLTELFLRFGRYIVVPLVFSTAIVSINNLRSSKLLLKTSLWTFLIIILSSLLLTLIGLLSILIVKLPRIPITVDSTPVGSTLNIKTMLLSLFPYSAFDSLKEGSFLLVSLIFAFLIGWESYSDQMAFKPIYALADACSKLFYNIANFFTEVLSVCMIAIMANWAITFHGIFSTGIYNSLLIMFIVDFIIVVGIIYPLVLYFVCHDPHPYKVLYASIAPLLLAFISGDSNAVVPLQIRHARESLGIRRRIRGFTFPLFSIFARGGSALVATISFILIWSSYSSLRIPFADILWIFGFSFGLSFLLGEMPTGGAFVLLSIFCQKYAKGFETSFLLLKPAALMICSFATMFDTATAMFGSYIVAVKTKMVEHHTIKHYI